MGSDNGIDGPASTAHCFYCFEVLSANFDRTTPPSLATVVELWEQYEADRNAGPSLDNTQLYAPPVDRTQDVSPASESTTTTSSSRTTRSTAQSSSSSLSSPASNSRQSLLPTLSSSYPVYVTWNTLGSRGKSLRGCIGTFEALPLEEGLKTFSLVSALEDHRFNPIPSTLIPQLGCELTLLADFETCKDPLDWTIGTHGIKISFVWKGRRHGATYLPHVCPEQGWTKEECVEHLMRKGGWEEERRGGFAKRIMGEHGGEGKGVKSWESVTEMKVVRYTGFHAAASYKEWSEWKAWAKRRL